jgi:hypothetical protein
MNLKQQFKSAIKLRTGETHILIKENPSVDFSKEIIKAALLNFAYDQQSEGSRDFYIAELINLSGQKDKILPVIYDALENESNDDWSTEQLFDIAAIFAKEGDERAKKAVYENYYKYAMNSADWAGEDAIIEIDGLKGLLYVAETKGKYLSENAESWVDSFFVDDFQKQNPPIDVYEELRKAARTGSFVKKYLETIEEHKFAVYKPNKDKKEKYDYQYVKDRFKNKYLGIGPRAIEKIPKKDLKKLADDFLKEPKRSNQEKYLRVFAYAKFPYDYQPILELAKSKNSKKDRFVYFAVEALKFFKAKDIRQFAVEKLSSTDEPEDYVNLLLGNYKKGDWKLLKSLAEKYTNDDVIHSLSADYIDIYEANPKKECKEPLEVIYDKMNCGLHRKSLVKILIDNDVLSEKIRNEIQFDSNEEIRKLCIAD